LWKTNTEEASRYHLAYVYISPNRKEPLQHTIPVSSTEKKIKGLLEDWKESISLVVGK
jgi:hypothetical protein